MRPPVRPVWGFALAALSALALFAAGEPFALGPLAWIAFVPVLVAIVRVDKVRWAWLYGLSLGVVYFGVHLVWIYLFGWMAWVGLTVFMALYWSLAAIVAALVRRRALAPMLVAGAFVGAELLRDRQPFGGYSWGTPGTTQATVPGVRWLAGAVGAYGLTFLIVFVAAVIAYRIAGDGVRWGSVAFVAVVLMGFVWADVARHPTRPTGRELQVLVVQGNVPRPAAPGQRDAIFESHLTLTQEQIRDGTDVVIWPEDALGVGVSSDALDRVRALAAQHATPFLVGQSIVDEQGFKNLVRYVDATGEVTGTYQKRHPVPFGEYVPIAALRRFVTTLEQIPLDQVPGDTAEVFDVDGTRIATPICFESVFPRDFLDFTRAGAELFVLSTNNASFERSYASQQHVAHAQMRALENRQWVVQAALSGTSATIRPDGEVRNATGLFEATTFRARVVARPASSLYAELGDAFAALFAIAAALGVLLGLRRTKNQIEKVRSE